MLKIKKINKSTVSAYKNIKTSMNLNYNNISICNGLDACARTGNGFC